jgi:hypothetical protein
MAVTASTSSKSSDLIELRDELINIRRLRDPIYQDVVKFVYPALSGWWTKDLLPPSRQPIWDDTAIKANRDMGNGMMGFTMSPSIRWFVMGLFGQYGEPIRAADIPGAAKWLRQVEDCLFRIFATSNFYDQGADMMALAGAFGSPTMWCEAPAFHGDLWSFQCQHPKSIWFDENERKVVDTHYRQVRLKARALMRLFPDVQFDNPKVWKEWNDAKGAWHNIEHLTFPNDEFDPGRIDKKAKRFRAVYMTEGGDILEDGGMDESRYLTWRWQTTSDQVYSESVSMDAMASIKILQQMKRTLIENAQLSTEPPILASQGLQNKLRIVPRGQNFIDSVNQKIEPIHVAGPYPVTDAAYQALKLDVQDFYFGDTWLMLERQKQRMTAYEVSQRIGEKSAILGPILARQQSEFADPLITMIFREEAKAGRLPPVPPALKAMKGLKLVPHYVGPLAVAQKRNGIMDSLGTALQAIVPIAQVRQEVLDNLNFDEWVRVVMESSGAPGEVVNVAENIQAIRAGRAQAQAQAQQAELQQTMAQNFKGLSTAPEQGSPGYALAKALGINQPEQSVLPGGSR